MKKLLAFAALTAALQTSAQPIDLSQGKFGRITARFIDAGMVDADLVKAEVIDAGTALIAGQLQVAGPVVGSSSMTATTYQGTANNAYALTNSASGVGSFVGFGTNLSDPGGSCNTTTSPSGFNSSLSFDGDGFFHVSCMNAAANRLSGVLVSNTTAVGNVGASGPDDLQTYTLPANVLVHTGRCLRITAIVTAANNVNAKTVRLVYGAGPTVIASKQITASSTPTTRLTGTICRTGSSAQRYWGEASMSGGTTISTTDGTGVAFIPTVTGTTTETETATIVIKTQSTTSTTDNDVVSQLLQVEAL